MQWSIVATGGGQRWGNQPERLQRGASPAVGHGGGCKQYTKIPNQTFLSLSGGCFRRWQGDLWNMGPVFESFASHVKEHRAEAQAVDPSGEEQVLLEFFNNPRFLLAILIFSNEKDLQPTKSLLRSIVDHSYGHRSWTISSS